MFSFLTAAIISQLNGLGPSFLFLLHSASENYVCGPPRGVPQIRSATIDFQTLRERDPTAFVVRAVRIELFTARVLRRA